MNSSIKTILSLTLATSLSLLAGCASTRSSNYADNKPLLSAHEYIQLSHTAQGAQKQVLLLKAAKRFAQDHQPQKAQQILNRLNNQQLDDSTRIQKQLVQANVYLQNRQADNAVSLLTNLEQLPDLDAGAQLDLHSTLALAYQQQGNIVESVSQRSQIAPLLTSAQAKQQNNNQIWQDLQSLSPETLQSLAEQSTDNAAMKGWLSLARLTKQYQSSPSDLVRGLVQWQTQYPSHPGNELLPQRLRHIDAAQIKSPNHIALLLPLSGPLAKTSDAIRNGFLAAYYQSKRKQANSPTVNVIDTSKGNIAGLYQKAIANGADMIVGPLTKPKLIELLANTRLTVPTLALNTLPPEQADKYRSDNLYQFGLSPIDEAQQAADKAWADHHSRALIITPGNEWGKGVADAFVQRWQSLGGQVIAQMNYTDQKTLSLEISKLLNIKQSYDQEKQLKRILHEKVRFIPRRRQDIDTIFLVADPNIARQIRPLLRFYFAGNIPVYAISQIYSGIPNPHRDRDLNGVLFCDMPWVLQARQLDSSSLTQVLQQVRSTWPRSYQHYPKLYALGVDAYDVANQLSTFKILPNIGTKAATGTLYLTARNHIYRKLIWSQIKNGSPNTL